MAPARFILVVGGYLCAVASCCAATRADHGRAFLAAALRQCRDALGGSVCCGGLGSWSGSSGSGCSVSEAPQWDIDGIDWPNRSLSRFVDAGALRWHVQRGGRGPTILLVHGTGSAAHSWRGLIPLLLDRFDVIAIDLPGHGFTQAPPEALVREQLSPRGMARQVSALLGQLDAKPVLAMGNSAGAWCWCGWRSTRALPPRRSSV